MRNRVRELEAKLASLLKDFEFQMRENVRAVEDRAAQQKLSKEAERRITRLRREFQESFNQAVVAHRTGADQGDANAQPHCCATSRRATAYFKSMGKVAVVQREVEKDQQYAERRQATTASSSPSPSDSSAPQPRRLASHWPTRRECPVLRSRATVLSAQSPCAVDEASLPRRSAPSKPESEAERAAPGGLLLARVKLASLKLRIFASSIFFFSFSFLPSACSWFCRPSASGFNSSRRVLATSGKLRPGAAVLFGLRGGLLHQLARL